MPNTVPHHWNMDVLKALWVQSGHRIGVVIDARSVAAELKMELAEYFIAILELVEADCLVYQGAGPKVEITEFGAMHCGLAEEGSGESPMVS